jgi:hypothetical protein
MALMRLKDGHYTKNYMEKGNKMRKDIVQQKKIALLWPYREDDQTTWKYLTCITGRNDRSKQKKFIKWVKNPMFKYAHLDPHKDE